MDTDHADNLQKESDKPQEILAVEELSDMETLIKLNGRAFTGDQESTACEQKVQSFQIRQDAEIIHYDISGLDLPWVNFLESLREYHLAALFALLTEADASAALTGIADRAMSTPSIILNEINESAMEHIGDLIIDAAFDPPILSGEYRPALECCIYKESRSSE